MAARLWGQQTLVNVATAGLQERPSITTLNNGNIVVVWRDANRGNGDIYGRLFNAAGQPISGEIEIGTGSSAQSLPSVSALANGGFVVAFQDGVVSTLNRFSESGAYVGTSSLSPNVIHPAVAGMTGGAAHTMVYTQGNLLGVARYDTTGTIINTQTVVSIGAAGVNADIARMTTGVVWMVWRIDTGEIGYRYVGASGTLNASTNYVSVTAPSDSEPRVAALLNGAAVMTWFATGTGYPSDGYDIYGQIIGRDGSITGPFMINARTEGNQTHSEVVGLPDGGFMAAWFDGSTLRAQVFDTFAQRVGREIVVSTSGVPVVAGGLELTLLADGRVAAVWNGAPGPTDTSGGVYMQIIDPRDGYVEGTGAANVLYGHDIFDDIIVGREGADTIAGMGGTDAIYAGDGMDTADGGFGDDMLDGGADADLLRGDAGNDLIYGGAADDIVAGGSGNDLIFGGLNNDWLEGGADNDTMFGEAGGDRLEGQDGNDVLDGGAGDDVLIGGAGNDIMYVDAVGDQVIEAAGGGIDLVYSSVHWLGNTNVENLVLTGNLLLNATMNGDANLVAGNGVANVINGAGGNDTIDGLGGNDWLGGGDGADRLDGGADNDTIQGGAGADALYGGAGTDSFYYGSYLDSNAVQGIDSIQDFQVGVDKINLTPARLSATDSATIVLAYGNAYVFVDLYGDGINDMIIEVIGATTLSGTDLNFVAPAAAAIYYGDDATPATEAEQAAAHHRASWDAVF